MLSIARVAKLIIMVNVDINLTKVLLAPTQTELETRLQTEKLAFCCQKIEDLHLCHTQPHLHQIHVTAGPFDRDDHFPPSCLGYFPKPL